MVVVARQLPEEINQATASVAGDLNLPESWLNDGNTLDPKKEAGTTFEQQAGYLFHLPKP